MAMTLKTLRLQALRSELEKAVAANDSKAIFRANNAIAKLLAKPRPKGTQPTSILGQRNAAAAAVLQKRQDARAAQLEAEHVRRNQALPIPIEAAPCAVVIEVPTTASSGLAALPTSESSPVSPQPEASPAASPAALQQAEMDNPSVRDEFQEMQATRHAAAPQPSQPVEPVPVLTDEERIAAAQKKMRDEWEAQMRNPFGVRSRMPATTGLSKADFDIDDKRIAKESVSDGCWVEKVIHPAEGRYDF
jgi:hypothetical protein